MRFFCLCVLLFEIMESNGQIRVIMRKWIVLNALAFGLLFQATLMAQTHKGNFVVLIASVENGMSTATLNDIGGVYHTVSMGNIYRYYVGGFNDESTAQTTAEKARSLGFPSARVVSTDYLKDMAAKCCMPVESDFKIRNIFFDFDKSDLKSASINELNKLVIVMKQNPSYTVQLAAHTDAKGDNAYNQALAERRVNAAVNYIKSRGIEGSRIDAKAYGETLPVAKNEEGGRDLPQGRAYNRRVEIRVIDGGSVIEEVENITDEVPDELQN